MNDVFPGIGKWLIVAGIILIVIGVVFLLLNRWSIPFKLPGDLVIRRKNFTFYFPLMTSIVLSILLTLIFYLINKFRQ